MVSQFLYSNIPAATAPAIAAKASNFPPSFAIMKLLSVCRNQAHANCRFVFIQRTESKLNSHINIVIRRGSKVKKTMRQLLAMEFKKK
jgi:hypothetical protein